MNNDNKQAPPVIENDLERYAAEIDEFRRIQAEEDAAEKGASANTEANERAKRAAARKQQQAAASQTEQKKEPQTIADLNIGQLGNGKAAEQLRAKAQEVGNYRANVSQEQEHKERVAELQEYNRTAGRGSLPIRVEDLPTKGMFYPEGTRIFIQAANLSEIKRWAMADETDVSAIDDAINDIVEACVRVVFPNDYKIVNADYRDLKDIDRLYLVLAVHDFTFPPEQGNDIKVIVNENTDVVVRKENIEFIKFGDKLMKYYNPEKRCFSFPAKARAFEGGYLDIYVPATGVTRWIKDYAKTRAQRQEGYDRDFIGIAPLLIPDHRGLNIDKYYDLIDSTADWTAYEWALINKVRRAIETAVTPKLIYKDEAGSTKEAPLNFRGGIKALLQPNLDIDL